ncbi:MAG TPA: HicB family protein [Deltaproteobacteria bacterium]|nr:MAG: hypothetical protein A2048_05415 [Deltaproteobacteria bacterium GWA2_45_12]HBF13396.1 HicB family protein [Deltaproteobacteria bacterium]
MELTAIIKKEGSQYSSQCLELEVASCGSTIKEAKVNLREAVELYLENLKELDPVKNSVLRKRPMNCHFTIIP